jgi:uncharacterized protein (TIGR02172 family)
METLEAIRIDLADYEYAGEGANGVSYNHRHDPDVMLKLYRPGLVQQPLDEMTIARKVYETGIPTPEPGDFVTDGTRYGVRFRRIRDKVSYARAVGDHPENLVRYAEEFAQMCRQLHATHVDTTAFECVKDKYSRQLVENPFFTPAEKDRLLRFILDAPDTDTAIHGDLQYGNALFVGDERYFIDLGDFGYGYPLFDIGMVYATAYISEPDFVREAFHMEPATSVRFWQAFAPVYFGTDRPLRDIEDEVRPYAGLKTIIVERDMGKPMPTFREALKPILHP